MELMLGKPRVKGCAMQRKECVNFGRVAADYEELRMIVELLWESKLQHAWAWDHENIKVSRKTIEAAAVGGGAVGASEHSMNMLVNKRRDGTKVIQELPRREQQYLCYWVRKSAFWPVVNLRCVSWGATLFTENNWVGIWCLCARSLLLFLQNSSGCSVVACCEMPARLGEV